MSRALSLCVILSLVFESVIAIMLLIFVYIPPFGILPFVENGKNLLGKINFLQNGVSENATVKLQLIHSLLVSYHQILSKLASLLAVVSVLLLVCLLVHLYAFLYVRKFKLSSSRIQLKEKE